MRTIRLAQGRNWLECSLSHLDLRWKGVLAQRFLGQRAGVPVAPWHWLMKKFLIEPSAQRNDVLKQQHPCVDYVHRCSSVLCVVPSVRT